MKKPGSNHLGPSRVMCRSRVPRRSPQVVQQLLQQRQRWTSWGVIVKTTNLHARIITKREKSTSQNNPQTVQGGPLIGKPTATNYAKHQRHFVGAPVNVVEKTFQNTTQMGRLAAVKGLKLWKWHKAPNPALNMPRRNEAVATDTIYGPGCPAVDIGSTAAQFFVGRKSGFCAVEGLGKSDKRHPVALKLLT